MWTVKPDLWQFKQFKIQKAWNCAYEIYELWKQAFSSILIFPGSQNCHNTKQGYTECRAVCGCFGNMSSNETICCHFPDKKSTNFCSNGGKTEKIKAKIEQGKGPSLNYVVSKPAIFDPRMPKLKLFKSGQFCRFIWR